jgi:acetyl-CoA acetyltransferase
VSELLEQRCIISGIGQSEIGRRLDRSEMALTLDACLAAIADAGLRQEDIDGLVTWPGDVLHTGGLTAGSPGFAGPSTPSVKDALRLNLNWHFAGPEGPAMLGSVVNACLAVASGLCRHVLVYRTLTEASAQRGVGRQGIPVYDPDGASGYLQWTIPFGGFSGGSWMAHYASRHFHQYGTTREQLGAIAINARRNAALNPKAIYKTPLSMEEYLASRMISTPLCLYDCDVPIDGSTAVVVSTADYVSGMPQPPVRFEAIGTALNGRASWDQWESVSRLASYDAAQHMWSRTDLKPSDVDVAQLSDGFTILTVLWLESLGFCDEGEAGPFVEGGLRIALDGALPLATGGGQLSAGRLHSFGHLHEAVVQLRGQAGERQVCDAEVAVVSSGSPPLSCCMVLTKG